MCNALVVREEYWDRQLDIMVKVFNIGINTDIIKRWCKVCENLVYAVCENIQQWIEIMVKVGKILIEDIQKGFKLVFDALSKLFKECDITSADDFDLVCDKLENRVLYLNWQNCIRQEQYYKSQFKLVKVNYNIMNHNRRC